METPKSTPATESAATPNSAFTINPESKFIRYSNNSVDDEDAAEIAKYLRQGYAIEVSSWCSGATRVQMVVSGTVSKVKELMGDEVEVAKAEIYSDRYPSYTLKAKDTEPKAETTLKSTISGQAVNSTTEPTRHRRHHVGDLTADGRYVWTEYAPNKFDWRKVRNVSTPETATAKEPTKPTKTRTIAQLLAHKPQGMSAKQERVFKLLRRGYRIGLILSKTTSLHSPDNYAIEIVPSTSIYALLRRMRVNDEEFRALSHRD
jgi:hypothetical protein